MVGLEWNRQCGIQNSDLGYRPGAGAIVPSECVCGRKTAGGFRECASYGVFDFGIRKNIL
jgi:hypothetical protein